MADFSGRPLISLGAALFLSACAQSISVSSVLIDDAYLSDQFRNNLVENVYKKADQLGGECYLRSKQRQYHSCSVETKGPSLRLSIGVQSQGPLQNIRHLNVRSLVPAKRSKGNVW